VIPTLFRNGKSVVRLSERNKPECLPSQNPKKGFTSRVKGGDVRMVFVFL
jgi:hypothetical protein